jgi:tetratricopeptide (TPR) repeat protein
MSVDHLRPFEPMAKKRPVKSSKTVAGGAPADGAVPGALREDRNQLWLKGLAIFFLSVFAYMPAMNWHLLSLPDAEKQHGRTGFIWDDDQLLTRNPAIQHGGRNFGPEALKGLMMFWAPKDVTISADYFPLTSTTLWFEWRLWGTNEPNAPKEHRGIGAPGYHTTNILLHAACAVLLWRALVFLGLRWAWVAALLWAVHPVCVESVAWISERKNTLSMLLYLATFGAWLKWKNGVAPWGYARALVWFVLACLAKTSVVPLPVVLLMILWWREGKVTLPDFKKTIPFFVTSVVFGLITIYFQHSRAVGQEFIPIGGIMREVADEAAKTNPAWGTVLNYIGRILGGSFALGFYGFTCLIPYNLILIYPQWHETLPWYVQIAPALGYTALFAVAWKRRATWGKHVLFGVGYFVVTLLPVIGLIKMSYMRLTLVADHFQYFSMPGLIALLVCGGAWLVERRYAGGATPLKVVFAAVAALFGAVSFEHSKMYEGMWALWTTTLKKNPNTWQANNHMGALLLGKGDVDKAMYHFKRGVELKPYNCEVHNNLGLAYALKGQMEMALVHYRRAVEIKGDDPSIRANLANALQQSGNNAEAVEHYKVASQLNPNHAGIRVNFGCALFALGRFREAEEQFVAATRLDPNMIEAQKNIEAVRRRMAIGAQLDALPPSGTGGR